MMADSEHHRIANQHAGDADHADHLHDRLSDSRDDPAGDQRDVLRHRHAEAADQHDEEHDELTVFGEQMDQVIVEGH